MPVQTTSIILPTRWATGVGSTGNETEAINNLLEHTSLEFLVQNLQEKQVAVTMTEVVAAGVPGNLNLWIELSPALTADDPNYWAAIGGGGGAQAPLAPTVIVPTGVNGTVHAVLIPWTMHSVYARLVVQMPVAATPATDGWTVQAQVSGKG